MSVAGRINHFVLPTISALSLLKCDFIIHVALRFLSYMFSYENLVLHQGLIIFSLSHAFDKTKQKLSLFFNPRCVCFLFSPTGLIMYQYFKDK